MTDQTTQALEDCIEGFKLAVNTCDVTYEHREAVLVTIRDARAELSRLKAAAHTAAEVEEQKRLSAEAAIQASAEECERHAQFLKSEAERGGNWNHLMTRSEEALYNAQRIRALAGRGPELLAEHVETKLIEA